MQLFKNRIFNNSPPLKSLKAERNHIKDLIGKMLYLKIFSETLGNSMCKTLIMLLSIIALKDWP